MSIDSAISILQDHALACATTDGTPILRAAPDYPIEDATALPFSVAYVGGGEANVANSSTVIFLPKLVADIHFSRTSIKFTYQLISAFIPQFVRRISGDPTLGGNVDTIRYPVTWSIGSAQWDQTTTQLIRFEIPIKTLETPL